VAPVRAVPGRDVYLRRNTFVRPAPRPYVRAPHVYGGRRFYAYHPYAFHRYRPFYFGPRFFPFGTFVVTLGAGAAVVGSGDASYYYDEGVWYLPDNDGYDVVSAPVGATIVALPAGATAVTDDVYYYGGVYYQRGSDGYTVVTPMAGTVVDNLPPGGEVVTLGDQTFVRFGDTYYQPISVDGQDKWEVVQIQQ
jgi:hypothetical protein